MGHGASGGVARMPHEPHWRSWDAACASLEDMREILHGPMGWEMQGTMHAHMLHVHAFRMSLNGGHVMPYDPHWRTSES